MDYNTTRDIPDTEYSEDNREQATEQEPTEQMSDNEFQEAAALIPDGDYHKSPLFYGILNYLGIDKNDDYLHAQKIADITDYVITKCKSNQIEDVLSTIRSLEDSMQPGLEGEKREDRLANYVGILAKKQGLDKKFSKLLSAYEKPKLKKEDLPKDVQNRMNARMTSLSECDICETDLIVKNTRGEHLCSKCTKLAPLLKRYQNFSKKSLTKAEKERILNSRTTSAGPRTYGK